MTAPGCAVLGGRRASGLLELTHDAARLDSGDWWAVAIEFDGSLTAARFADVETPPERADSALLPESQPWRGPAMDEWESSLSRAEYMAAVERLREHIAAGDVYQANLCRILSTPWPGSLAGLAAHLRHRHAAPFAGYLSLPTAGVEIVSASPELYLRRRGRRLESGPIKGTGRHRDDLSPKDVAENVMIVDLVRNDLGRVAVTGSVDVPDLLAVEEHPGLVHLVSTVACDLRPGTSWADVLDATFPPGSVTGAPKHAALGLIAALEPVPRGPYCGAIGWVQGDDGELAVAIRTFFTRAGRVCFGTGAGITYGSDAAAEWEETQLKAERLIRLASGVDG